MSKMACICGNVISDVVCPSPTESWLTGNEDRDRLQAECSAAVKSFLAALVAGRKEEWIRSFFLPIYRTGPASSDLVK
jgi:hypothetical protein